MSYDGDMGANLEEIYKAGNVEVPAIANAFRSAANGFSQVSVTGPLTRSSDLGLGATGCSTQFQSLLDALQSAADGARKTMDAVADNLVLTAQDLAKTDSDVRAAYVEAGGRL